MLGDAPRRWMALCLPPAVAVGHVLLAGALTATIVTVSHQAEDLFHEHQDDWVASQVPRSSRDTADMRPRRGDDYWVASQVHSTRGC